MLVVAVCVVVVLATAFAVAPVARALTYFCFFSSFLGVSFHFLFCFVLILLRVLLVPSVPIRFWFFSSRLSLLSSCAVVISAIAVVLFVVQSCNIVEETTDLISAKNECKFYLKNCDAT